jgi:AbrB family looped-hinge helix DNA binding protein
MQATLTSKGQITVPKAIREKLRLHAGDKLDFFLRDDGHVEMVPVRVSMKDLKSMIPPPVKGVSLEDMDRAVAEGAGEYGRD